MATVLRSVPARDTYRQDVHEIRKTFTFATATSGVAQTIGTLPANAMVVGGGLSVSVAFNSSGTDLVDVGTALNAAAAADPNAYGSALDVAATGFKALDELATATALPLNAEVPVTLTYTQSIVDATAGTMEAVIQYVINRG